MTASLPARRFALVMTTVVAPMLLLAACNVPPAAPPPSPPRPVVVVPAPPPPPPRVIPVEAEPAAPATQLSFNPSIGGPLSAMLVYADKLRTLPASEIAAEINRIGDPGDSPSAQMQLALALAQTRAPADLAKALTLMQRIAGNQTQDAQPFQSLARALASRYQEQRRVEDDRDRQGQQVRDAQKRIEQLSDRLEALRAIERSVSRPNAPAAASPAGSGSSAPNGGRQSQP